MKNKLQIFFILIFGQRHAVDMDSPNHQAAANRLWESGKVPVKAIAWTTQSCGSIIEYKPTLNYLS